MADQHDWRSRMRDLLSPREESSTEEPSGDDADTVLEAFIDQVVMPALNEIKYEVERQDRAAEIRRGTREAYIVVHRNGEEFSYGVRGRVYYSAPGAFPAITTQEHPSEFKAEVLLYSGNKQRPIEEVTRQWVIEDFIREFEKWAEW